MVKMMKNRMLLGCLAAATVMMTWSVAPSAQRERSRGNVTAQTNDEWCSQDNWGDDREGVCEVREFTVAGGASTMTVDAAPNGGIQVEGAGRSDILVRAKVVATASTMQRAREILSAVRVDAAPDRVNADGPDGLGRREGWHVSYRLSVPNQTSMSLSTTNGGISITDVSGRIEFKTVNGGVKLRGLGGDVRGRTNNGGVDVDLDGATWHGEGLDVQTNNGGVKLSIPADYSARLETGTVNGGLQVDFPLMVQGRIDREIQADLGGGGPLIRVRTSNGGVKIGRK